jgi:hypothetical protein
MAGAPCALHARGEEALGVRWVQVERETAPFGGRGLRVAKQGYLALNDHGGAGGQVAFSYCRSLYALALMFPPKLSSHSVSSDPIEE